jgi:hypothetical protein
MTAPRLLAAKLMFSNRVTKSQALALMAVSIAAMLALAWVLRGPVAVTLHWLRSHSLLCLGVAIFASAILVARRRAARREAFARSWLAAVPIPVATARLERWSIETLPATTAIAVLTVTGACIAAALPFGSGTEPSALIAAWGCACGGVVLGMGLSYLIPPPKAVELPPGSRYVPHAKAHRTATIRPSLKAVGYWPIRQMFAWAQPKMLARATLPICVMMPLGSTAATAMIVLAAFGVIGGSTLLWFATLSVSRLIRQWLAPLPVNAFSVMRALLLPTLAVMLGAGAMTSVLLLASDVVFHTAALAGLCSAAAMCILTVGAAVLAR